jgi:hypothetical protein
MKKKGQSLFIFALVGIGIFLFFSFIITLATPALRDLLLPWTKYNNEVNSAQKVVEKTYDADNVIYNYEWFKRQQEDIRATEKQIDNTIQQQKEFVEFWGPPNLWDTTTKEEYNRITKNLVGQKNFYADLVAEYNARSQMANRAIFENGLPRNIDKRLW